jgi:hypothetical protein
MLKYAELQLCLSYIPYFLCFLLERRFLDSCIQLQIQRTPFLMHTEFKEAKSLLFCVCR